MNTETQAIDNYVKYVLYAEPGPDPQPQPAKNGFVPKETLSAAARLGNLALRL